MDSVNSTTFIKRPPCVTDAQEGLLYTKEILSGRIFLGSYEERRYVSVLNDYRDLVITSPEETDLHHDLDKVRKKLLGLTGIKWVGITGPELPGMPKTHCFWVKFSNLPFGHYWFQIKHVKLVEGEILLHLKYIRKSYAPAYATASHTSVKNVNTKQSLSKNEVADMGTASSSSNKEALDIKEAFLSFYKACNEANNCIQPYITWKNVFTVIRVTCAVVIALVLGTISFVGHLGEYVLKLLRELSILVQAFTPIIIQLIDFCTKIVGGLFILLAGMFRTGPPRPYPPVPSYRPHSTYSIPYSFVMKQQPTNQTPPVDWKERNRILRQELLIPQREL